ncbi:MAG: hypothetical protein ACI8RZ_005084 [Myxococcota bacterium]|jgi:hypothetical protein
MHALTKLLPWILLLNAGLMVLIAERYAVLEQEWAVHQMAAESCVLLLEERPR